MNILNSVYYQYYLFFKYILKENDIPLFNATIFVSALELMLISLVMNLLNMIIYNNVINKLTIMVTAIIILGINLYQYHYIDKSNKIKNDAPVFISVGFTRSLAIAFPFLLFFLFILSMDYGMNFIENANRDF